MRVFVLSGGGSYGALQAGALEVLLELGLQPDMAVGALAVSPEGVRAWRAADDKRDLILPRWPTDREGRFGRESIQREEET